MDTITAVICTLNQIEVHGKDNLNRLLACIQELEKLRELRGQQPSKGGLNNG